VSVA
jgi:hypothetical protein